MPRLDFIHRIYNFMWILTQLILSFLTPKVRLPDISIVAIATKIYHPILLVMALYMCNVSWFFSML